KNQDPLEKAQKFANKINNEAKDLKAATANRIDADTAEVNVPKATIAKLEINSVQNTMIIKKADARVEIGYRGAPTATDEDGFESVFEASFGSDNLFVDAAVNFSSLPSPSVSALLTAIFSQFISKLQEPLRPNLRLDLANQKIIFDFPPNEFNTFVKNRT